MHKASKCPFSGHSAATGTPRIKQSIRLPTRHFFAYHVTALMAPHQHHNVIFRGMTKRAIAR